MTIKDEKGVKKRLQDYFKANDIYYVMYVPMGFGAAGIPDFLVCWNGLFLGVETKYDAKTNKVTPLQKANLLKIKRNGGAAWVVDKHNVDHFISLLKDNKADELIKGTI